MNISQENKNQCGPSHDSIANSSSKYIQSICTLHTHAIKSVFEHTEHCFQLRFQKQSKAKKNYALLV